jgi:hypothetical protein
MCIYVWVVSVLMRLALLLAFGLSGVCAYPLCTTAPTLQGQEVCSHCVGTCDVAVSIPVSCPAHAVTLDAGSFTPVDCKCVAGYYGTVTEAALVDSCQACIDGTYSLAVGAASIATCSNCLPGYYCPAISGSPIACPPGTYNGNSLSTLPGECASFPAGMYGNVTAATSLDDAKYCSIGMYSTVVGATLQATCVVCPVGEFCSTVGTAPLPCTVLPTIGATYHGPGTNHTNCPWTCDAGYYLAANGTSCVPCSPGSWCIANTQNTCPGNSQSAAYSFSQNQCICLPGYHGDGSKTGTSPCTLCRPGSYCIGGNANASVACPANSSTPYGAFDLLHCVCLAGYEGLNGTACSLCGTNTYCASGELSRCPEYSSAPSGSYLSSDCVANPGYYTVSLGDVPMECPASYYCTGGISIQQCTPNAISSGGSPSSDSCFCDKGYVGLNNTVCKPCNASTWCWTGVLNQCPEHSTSPALSSYMKNCSCLPGYGGTVGGACAQCLAGTYKSDFGNHNCTGCVSGSTYSSTNVATSCSPCTQCSAGHFTSSSCTLTSDATCLGCPDNYQCHDGIMTACPLPTVSFNASSYLDCKCPSGSFGQVLSESAAYCEVCPAGMFCPAVVTKCACVG